MDRTLNLVSIGRCSRSPRNPEYPRLLDPSVLGFNLSFEPTPTYMYSLYLSLYLLFILKPKLNETPPDKNLQYRPDYNNRPSHSILRYATGLWTRPVIRYRSVRGTYRRTTSPARAGTGERVFPTGWSVQ